MVNRKVRWIALLLAFLLVFAAAPLGALAESWTLSANLPTDPASALTTNSRVIDLSVTFNNVVNIKCLVKPQGSQAISTYENPQIQGNTAVFSGVVLAPGVNEVSFVGTSGSLQVQSVTYYVEYLNNPRIMNMQLQGVAVDQDDVAAVGPSQNNPPSAMKASWQYDTENATWSTVNGLPVTGTPVGTKMNWSTLLDLKPGESPLTTVASNNQRSVTVKKSVILVDAATNAAPFDVVLSDNNGKQTNLWAGIKVQASGVQPVTVGGKFVAPATTATAPTVQVSVDGGPYQSATVTPSSQTVPWVKQWGVKDQLAVWTWSLNIGSLGTGDHKLTLSFAVDGTGASQTIEYPFSFIDTNQPYWSDPVQLFNVTTGSTAGVYRAGQAIQITEPWVVSQTPVALGLTLNNLGGSPDFANNVTVQAVDAQDQPIATITGFTAGSLESQPNTAVILFPSGSLPAGEYDLKVTYNNGGTPISVKIHTVVQLSPMLKVTLKQNNDVIADGQVVTKSDPLSAEIVPVNFNAFPDPVTGTLNGIALNLQKDSSTNPTKYTVSNIQLSEGTNTFVFEATDPVTKRVTVRTTLTVYRATPTDVTIDTFQPWTPDGQTLPFDQDTQSYTTSSQRVELEVKLGPVAGLSNNPNAINRVDIYKSGTLLTSLYANNPGNGYVQAPSSAGGWWYDPGKIKPTPSGDSATAKLTFWVSDRNPQNNSEWVGVSIPPNQTTSFKLVAYVQTSNGQAISQQVTKTILVVNQLKPYEVYVGTNLNQPVDLTQPLQVNQNFLDIVIATPAPADSVTVNRQPAVEWKSPPGGDPAKSYYGVEIKDLKPGLNKIPFVVQSGPVKESGTLLVNNLEQALMYAKSKVYFGKSTSFKAFDGKLQLQFPRNTMLAPAVQEGQNLPDSTGATNDRYLLFGIADPSTGYIEKNSTGSAGYQSVPQGFAPGGWVLASPVYWIDAGPKSWSSVSLPPFIPAGGIDPFQPGYSFSQRGGPRPGGGSNDWLQPTKEGTLVLSYDPAIRNQEAGRLTVFHLDPSGPASGLIRPWVNLGGVVNVSNHTITVPFRNFGYYVVAKEVYSYSDVASHPWAKEYIETMFAKGIMKGDPSLLNAFNPDVPISRGEFTAMVVKMLGIPLDYDDNNRLFIDVGGRADDSQLYDYRYIETAAKKGIVHGVSPNLFRPGDPLSRQEAATIIASALNLKLGDPKAARATLSRLYGDANAIDLYAAPAVLAVSQKKIMEGSPAPGGTGGRNQKPVMYFNPASQLTRAEAAAIAYKVMQQLKKL